MGTGRKMKGNEERIETARELLHTSTEVNSIYIPKIGANNTDDGSLEIVPLMTIKEVQPELTSVDAEASSSTADTKLNIYKKHQIARRSKMRGQLARENQKKFARYKNNMHCEISRQHSFLEQLISSQLTVNKLAAKGFYFGGRDDDTTQIKCAFCNVAIFLTEAVNSMTEVEKCHYSLKPDCPFLRGNKTQNIPDIYHNSLWANSETGEINSPSSLSDLGINNSFAKHPLLAVPDNRISTYLTFPHTYRSNIDIDLLSEAGYFYKGDGDSVTCFYCGCHSRKWRSGEDVWKRHARTSPSCQHVLSTKGASFVSDTLQELGEYQTPRVEDHIQNVTTRMIRPRWDAPAIRRAIEMGIDRTQLKTVVINRIKRGERDFRYLAEIVQAINYLKVPPSNSPNDTEEVERLPKLVQLNHSYESDSEEDAGRVEETNQREGSTGNTDVQADNAQELPQSSEAMPELELKINVRDTITQLTCKICFSAVVGIIFLPCGHLACCVSCAPAMVDCPICRKTINGTIQAFMP